MLIGTSRTCNYMDTVISNTPKICQLEAVNTDLGFVNLIVRCLVCYTFAEKWNTKHSVVCFNIASNHLHLQNCQEGLYSSNIVKQVLNKLSGQILLIFFNCTCWQLLLVSSHTSLERGLDSMFHFHYTLSLVAMEQTLTADTGRLSLSLLR